MKRVVKSDVLEALLSPAFRDPLAKENCGVTGAQPPPSKTAKTKYAGHLFCLPEPLPRFPFGRRRCKRISRTNNGATDEVAGPEQSAAYEGTARHLLSRAMPEAIEVTIPPNVVFSLHTVIRKPRTPSADLGQHKPYPYTPLLHSQDTHVLEFCSARDGAETDIREFEVRECRGLP